MKLLYKTLDIARMVLIVAILGMLAYKYTNKQELNLQLNTYLQTTIFVLIAIEAFRMFGPKQEE